MRSDGLDRHRLALILRWAAFAPLGVICGAFARIMLFEGTWAVYEIMGVDPFAFLPMAFVFVVPHAVQGAVTVLIAVWVAPAHRNTILLVATSLTTLLSAYFLFLALVAGDGWGVCSALSLSAGAGAVAWSLYSDARRIHRASPSAAPTQKLLGGSEETSGATSDRWAVSKRSIVGGLRWVAFLPGALLAGTIAYMVIYWGNRWIFHIMGTNPDSFFNSLFLEGVPYAAFGAVLVFAAAWVVPTRKMAVAFGMSILSVLIACIALFVGWAARDWWSIYNAVAQVVGTVVLVRGIYSGEVPGLVSVRSSQPAN